MLSKAAFHRNWETGIRTMEEFLYDSLLTLNSSISMKNNNGIRSWRKLGIGYAMTCGNLRLGFLDVKASEPALRSTGSEVGEALQGRQSLHHPKG